MLANRIDLAEEANLTALGGGYFFSLGITTERVYPFIANARMLPRKITAGLVFCRLSDVLARPDRIGPCGPGTYSPERRKNPMRQP
jgi:hypothetical protein